jgi:hypothetical protein
MGPDQRLECAVSLYRNEGSFMRGFLSLAVPALGHNEVLTPCDAPAATSCRPGKRSLVVDGSVVLAGGRGWKRLLLLAHCERQASIGGYARSSSKAAVSDSTAT